MHAVAVQLDLRRFLAVIAAVFRSGGDNAVAAGMRALMVGLLGHLRDLLGALCARGPDSQSSAGQQPLMWPPVENQCDRRRHFVGPLVDEEPAVGGDVVFRLIGGVGRADDTGLEQRHRFSE